MMDRRKFIRTGLGAVGGMILPWERALAQAEESGMEKKSRVWMAQGDPVKAARALAQAIGGLDKFVPPDGMVLVKPNIVFAMPPQWGGTTDPDFVAAVIDLCIEAGAREVVVADHMVGSDPQKNLDTTGIGGVCEGMEKVRLVDIQARSAYKPVDVVKGLDLKRTMTAKILDEVDFFINLPTAKHGVPTGISMGIKNLMGLIWDRKTFHDDMDLHQAIADLATIIRPDLTFLDGRYVMRSGGPKGPGEVDEVNRYLVGFDPMAVDAVGVKVTGSKGQSRDAKDIRHLARAYELGVGEIENIEVIKVG